VGVFVSLVSAPAWVRQGRFPPRAILGARKPAAICFDADARLGQGWAQTGAHQHCFESFILHAPGLPAGAAALGVECADCRCAIAAALLHRCCVCATSSRLWQTVPRHLCLRGLCGWVRRGPALQPPCSRRGLKSGGGGPEALKAAGRSLAAHPALLAAVPRGR